MSKEKQLLEKKIENLIFIKSHDPSVRTKINKEQWIDLTQLISVADLYNFINDTDQEILTIKIGDDLNLNAMFIGLITKVQNQIRDNEINPLYIAFDFICGKEKSSNAIIKAPLHFLPVRIRFQKRNIIIEKFQDAKIVNDKLFFFLKQKKVLNDYKTFVSEQMKYPHVELPLDSIECDYNFKRCDGFVLGIYELCDTFFYDTTKSVAAKNSDLFKTKTKLSKEKISNIELSAGDIIQVTPNPLNIYQRRALISALNQNTIIYGPPGTGKSETITNFIATILNWNKTAIITSEKNAALQVIKERLGELSDFCFFADTTLTKKDFYNRIKKVGDLINYSERKKWVIKKPTYYENDNSKKKLIEKINKNIDFYHSTASGLNLTKYFELFKHFEKDLFLKNSLERMKDKAQQRIVELVKLIKRLELNYDFKFKQLIEIIETIKQDLNLVNFDLRDKLTIGQAVVNARLINNLLDEKEIEYVKKNWNIIFDELNSINFLLSEFTPYCDTFKEILNNETIINNFVKGYDNAGKKTDKFVVNFLKVNGLNIREMGIEKTFGLNQKGQKIKLGLYAASRNPLINSKNSEKIMEDISIFDQLSSFILKHPYFQDQSIQECLNVDIDYFVGDKKVLDYILINKITQEELETLISLVNFEREIIVNANANNIPTNENNLYETYYKVLKQNQNSIIDVIKIKLIENLQYKISKIKSSNIQDQIDKIFQLSNLDKKVDIDKFISTYKEGLHELFDIWLGRPEQLTHYLYPSKKEFDYGIFDEASQMYMERSLTILNKTKINIIAGDDKQLKPSNWFESRYETSEYDLDVDSAESLLERAKVAMWPEFILKYHYRSRSYELIKFSNDEFYNKELEYASWNNEKNRAIEIYDVDGYIEDGKNIVEAQTVLQILIEKYKQYKKIIVVTFGIKQAELITSYVLKSNNNELKERVINGSIIIINLENVQGNEADLIIISNTYGKNVKKQTMNNNFGSLIQNGGKNRLNVALTRAREKMIIVKSFKSADMAWNRDNENAVSYYHWIKYLDEYKIEKQNLVTVETSKWSGIEEFINQKLEENFKIQTGYTVGSKVFDFFIINLKNNLNIGIEVIGFDYFPTALNLIEDFETHLFLRNRNYNCLFISEYDWNTNPIRIINEIKTCIDKPSQPKLTFSK